MPWSEWLGEMSFYRFCQRLVTGLWPLIGRLEVEGGEAVPDEGPFLLIANHQSILDPVIIQSVCPRPIHTMAKSTQFGNPIMAELMCRLNGFPVRRYQIDPQAVRHALRLLHEEDEPVGVYVEGERSWDGRLQTPRIGTLRLILKAGVPVIPCTIEGSYDIWPRWDRGLRRAPLRITFGAPLHFPRYDDRETRDAAIPETARTIMAAIARPLKN